MRTLLQDLRFGTRMLLKKPGFTIVAVITLALGIGANTAVFSLINAVLLNPLPFYEPAALVMVWEEASLAGFPRQEPAPANYVDWKARQSVFEDMAALAFSNFRLTGDGEPQQIFANSECAGQEIQTRRFRFEREAMAPMDNSGRRCGRRQTNGN
jgi:putative ABC transport system permease protein